jgi:peptidylprolyl isomerase domain and WD repeat-containing protein 1
VLYSTVVGIKLLDWKRNKLLTVLGRVEGTERFMNLALYQGQPKMRIQELTGGSESGPLMETDPTLVCTSFDRERFFLFTKRLPGEQRDVFNEAALEATKVVGTVTKKRTPSIAHKATIYTTMGDIVIELHPKECRKTVENFSAHARNGYYDSVIFHRVIKNFMIQTGDPRGDGTGGTSIWGTDFQDEFNPNLRHDKPYMVSMANTGAPNTNGSQFFITTVAAPWLDNKHTVFGRVLEGIEVVQSIGDLETDNNDRPKNQDVRILSIKVV